MLQLNEIETLACGGLSLLVGYFVLERLPLLQRLNIPAPVIGGLLTAVAVMLARHTKLQTVTFDVGLQSPLMIAFFTSIGCNASVSLLRASGRQVVIFLGLAALLGLLQSLLGMGIATAFGLHPLFGVLAGTATLAGGPATGLAFAPLFEQAGLTGAQGIAVASAMAGIVCGGLFGGPVGSWFVQRYKLKTPAAAGSQYEAHNAARAEPELQTRRAFGQDNCGTGAAGDAVSSGIAAGLVYRVIKTLVLILVCMWIGAGISAWLTARGIRLPDYIGAMIVGALIRNLDDFTGWFGLARGTIEGVGTICLAFFLALALMNLKLWELSGLALPLLINITAQVALVVAFCAWPLFAVMGRDYDAAVIAGGFTGFMLGITANAMAVMQAMVERNGPAPRAFLVVPLVGAFFIDFTDTFIIMVLLNLLR